VPTAVVNYYEDSENSENIRKSFDDYEIEIFNRVEKIIKGEN